MSQELVLIIYVHGFKGTDVTFEKFPERVQHLVQETVTGVTVRTEVFPVYETKGELRAATDRFIDWLTTLTVSSEVSHGSGGGAGKAKVVLCGHSMGGLLIADAVISIKKHAASPDVPLWPRIIAVIAFDTPYLGLHPHVFKNSISKYASHLETAKQVATGLGALSPFAMGLFGASQSSSPSASSSSTSKPPTPKPDTQGTKTTTKSELPPAVPAPKKGGAWLSPTSLLSLSALAATAAAAGTAYYKRDTLMEGWGWVGDHAVWLGNLWDSEGMKGRLGGLGELGGAGGGGEKEGEGEKDRDGEGQEGKAGNRVVFRNFYTLIPPSPPTHILPRSFCLLPSPSHPLYPLWVPSKNSFAADEVAAHLGMFNAKDNEGFYQLGLEVAGAVMEGVEGGREWDERDGGGVRFRMEKEGEREILVQIE